MKKLKLIALSISLLILTNTLASNTGFIKPANTISSSFIGKYTDISKKRYYEEIFNKSERKQLKKAQKYLASAKKYMNQYDASQREIEKLYTIAEATSSAKSREKALKKARKIESKSLKKGFKALSYYKKANDIKTKVYATAINRIRPNDDSKSATVGRNLEMEAKTIFENASTKERTAPQHDEQLKFNTLREANILTQNALKLQEKAFGVYKNDESVNTEDIVIPDSNVKNDTINDVIKKDSVLFPVYTEYYNPATDANLYRSKANIILPKLKLSTEEQNMIIDANNRNTNANNLLRQVDEAYITVDSLNFVADRTEDTRLRDEIRTRAIEKEHNAFYKLTKATNEYLNVNEIRYKVYKKHMPIIPADKLTADTEKAKRYSDEADDYFNKAKSDIQKAKKLMYRSEEYLKLMGANDLMLYALQLQESAYGIYLGIPDAISTQIDTSFVADNTINNSQTSVKKENTSSSLSWELLAKYSYSEAKPKPVKYKNKKGVVFMVQVGIFKGLLPPAKFGNVQPIIFDKFVKNPFRRYMVGEYKTYEAAELALSKVKSLGYSDAYILALIDGERNKANIGKSIINRNDADYARIKNTEIARIKGEKYIANNSSNNNSNNNSSNNQQSNYSSSGNVKNTQGLVYFVQLGMFSNPDAMDKFKNLQPLFTEKISGRGTRYLYGNFGTLAMARRENQTLKNKGFNDSYVTAYYNGEHISLDRAKNLEKQHGTGSSSNNTANVKQSSGSISFMVQVGAYTNKLDASELNKLKNNYSPRSVSHKYSGGKNLYTVGNYKTYKEAKYLQKKLVEEGHNGVFVIALEGNNKIPVGEAIKKQN